MAFASISVVDWSNLRPYVEHILEIDPNLNEEGYMLKIVSAETAGFSIMVVLRGVRG